MTLTAIHTVPDAWLPPTESWLHRQIRFLPAGIESHVLCRRTENLDQFPVDNVHQLTDASLWRCAWERALRRLRLRRSSGYLSRCARRVRPDVIHSHFGPSGWEHRRLARRLGAKHVVTFYGLDVGYLPRVYPAWRQRYRALFRGIHLVLCEGPHMAGCVQALGCPPDKVHVHHLGVETDRVAFRPVPWHPSEPLRILIAASFREKKGIPVALDAIARLRPALDVQVTVIGDASGDPRSSAEKARILSTIERRRLGRCVRMLGFQPHDVLMREAARHHLFLAPSITAADGDTEGGAPVVLLEMMAAGLLVVSTTHCDIPGIVEDGVTGRLAPERDAASLARCIESLTAAPETWPAMQGAARRHVEQAFDAREQGRRLGRIYESLMEAA